MTDLDPEIWKNKTLGEAGSGPFLPEVERQAMEDRNAKVEGREPAVIEYVHRYPTMPPAHTIPSQVDEFRYTNTNSGINEDMDKYPVGDAVTAKQAEDPILEARSEEVKASATEDEDEDDFDYTFKNEE